jgi:hypothetical protein
MTPQNPAPPKPPLFSNSLEVAKATYKNIEKIDSDADQTLTKTYVSGFDSYFKMISLSPSEAFTMAKNKLHPDIKIEIADI